MPAAVVQKSNPAPRTCTALSAETIALHHADIILAVRALRKLHEAPSLNPTAPNQLHNFLTCTGFVPSLSRPSHPYLQTLGMHLSLLSYGSTPSRQTHLEPYSPNQLHNLLLVCTSLVVSPPSHPYIFQHRQQRQQQQQHEEKSQERPVWG